MEYFLIKKKYIEIHQNINSEYFLVAKNTLAYLTFKRNPLNIINGIRIGAAKPAAAVGFGATTDRKYP